MYESVSVSFSFGNSFDIPPLKRIVSLSKNIMFLARNKAKPFEKDSSFGLGLLKKTKPCIKIYNFFPGQPRRRRSHNTPQSGQVSEPGRQPKSEAPGPARACASSCAELPSKPLLSSQADRWRPHLARPAGPRYILGCPPGRSADGAPAAATATELMTACHDSKSS